jgi:hypothetical protein
MVKAPIEAIALKECVETVAVKKCRESAMVKMSRETVVVKRSRDPVMVKRSRDPVMEKELIEDEKGSFWGFSISLDGDIGAASLKVNIVVDAVLLGGVEKMEDGDDWAKFSLGSGDGEMEDGSEPFSLLLPP